MKPLAAVLPLLLAVPAAAQPQAVLMVDPKSTKVSSVDRLDEVLEQVANSVTVITRQEIELRNQPFVSDLLRTVPGVDVVQSGARGGTTSAFLRGMNSEHTLVLLDGVPLNDPSSPARAYDLANLTTDNVERIEIMRGPQSVMYGSDAMAGVISIITRKGEGPFKATLYGEGGSYNTALGKGDVSGSSKHVDYSFGGSRQYTGGFPSAGSDYGAVYRDNYRNTTVSGSIAVRPAENLRLDFIGRNTNSFYHIPDGGNGPAADDPSNIGKDNETDLSARGTLSLLDGTLAQKLTAGVATQTRRFLDDVSPLNPAAFSDSSSYGQTLRIGYQAIAKVSEHDTVTAGFDYQREEAHTTFYSVSIFGPFQGDFADQRNYTKGVYLENLVKFDDRLFMSIGGREDRNYRYGNAYTYRVSPTFLIPETRTKLKATVGTGFKAPALFQLYSAQAMIPTLSPERSFGLDAGFEQSLFGNAFTLGATYFRNYLRDLISFNPAPFPGFYYNVGRAKTEGYEAEASVRPVDWAALKGNYTYTSAMSLADNTALLRRPRTKFGGDLELHPTKTATVLVGGTYTGSRADMFFPPPFFVGQAVTLGGYALWHLSGSYQVCKGVQLTARVENLLNKRYEEIEGFGSMGAAGYGGVRLQF